MLATLSSGDLKERQSQWVSYNQGELSDPVTALIRTGMLPSMSGRWHQPEVPLALSSSHSREEAWRCWEIIAFPWLWPVFLTCSLNFGVPEHYPQPLASFLGRPLPSPILRSHASFPYP